MISSHDSSRLNHAFIDIQTLRYTTQTHKTHTHTHTPTNTKHANKQDHKHKTDTQQHNKTTAVARAGPNDRTAGSGHRPRGCAQGHPTWQWPCEGHVTRKCVTSRGPTRPHAHWSTSHRKQQKNAKAHKTHKPKTNTTKHARHTHA